MCWFMTSVLNPSMQVGSFAVVSSAPLLPGGVVCAGSCCRGARPFFDGPSMGEAGLNHTVLRGVV